MFSELWDEDALFRLNNHTSFEGQPPKNNWYFEISSIDICGNYEPISTKLSEISFLSGKLIFDQEMYKYIAYTIQDNHLVKSIATFPSKMHNRAFKN